MGHPMRLELTQVGLLVKVANHYTTKGAHSPFHISLSLSLSLSPISVSTTSSHVTPVAQFISTVVFVSWRFLFDQRVGIGTLFNITILVYKYIGVVCFPF